MDSLTEQDKLEVLEQSATIKLSTINQILRCLDVATSRGTFKGNELTFVGNVYDTLSRGLNQAFSNKIDSKKTLETVEESTEE